MAELSATDVLTMMNSKEDGINRWMDNPFIYLIFYQLFQNWGVNGRTNGCCDPCCCCATKADVCEAINNNQIDNALKTISSDMCQGFNNVGVAVLQAQDALNQNLCNNFNATNMNMYQGFNQAQRDICDLGHQNQLCCCEINRNIDAVRDQNDRNTCDIIRAGQDNTKEILAYLTNERINQLQTELGVAIQTIANGQLKTDIVNEIRPFPVPAYTTCSPYCNCGVCPN